VFTERAPAQDFTSNTKLKEYKLASFAFSFPHAFASPLRSEAAAWGKEKKENSPFFFFAKKKTGPQRNPESKSWEGSKP